MGTQFITLVEAAYRLHRPYQDCHRLVLLGELRAERQGRRWMVVEEDVERLRGEVCGSQAERAVS